MRVVRARAGIAFALSIMTIGAAQAAASAAPPSDPPPKLAKLKGPPPAWGETARGSRWLGYSSFCWATTCADFIPPRCGDLQHTPTLVVRRGHVVRFHLAFSPTELALAGADLQQHKLPLTRTPTWRFTRAGAFRLFARAKAGGDASYVGCIRFLRSLI